VAEASETLEALGAKLDQLHRLFSDASHVTIHTGAGISTAAGIPDFRGVGGIWTERSKGGQLPATERCWNNAMPTLAHRAIARLTQRGRVHCVITQNIDGLHRRSGVPNTMLAELHGNIFQEKCLACGVVFERSFDVGGVGFRPTGRQCSHCGGELIDQLLDWEDDLPERDFDLADSQSETCSKPGGLAICLGTSMQMTPARDWPLMAHRVVIVNLQPTIKDSEVHLVIHARIDDVMRDLMHRLGEPIPEFQRVESFIISHTRLPPHSACGAQQAVELRIGDALGAPCGFLLSVEILDLDDSALLLVQPFKKTLRFGEGTTLRLRIRFVGVPLGKALSYTPPEQTIAYQVAGESGSQVQQVTLSPPATWAPPGEQKGTTGRDEE